MVAPREPRQPDRPAGHRGASRRPRTAGLAARRTPRRRWAAPGAGPQHGGPPLLAHRVAEALVGVAASAPSPPGLPDEARQPVCALRSGPGAGRGGPSRRRVAGRRSRRCRSPRAGRRTWTSSGCCSAPSSTTTRDSGAAPAHARPAPVSSRRRPEWRAARNSSRHCCRRAASSIVGKGRTSLRGRRGARRWPARPARRATAFRFRSRRPARRLRVSAPRRCAAPEAHAGERDRALRQREQEKSSFVRSTASPLGGNRSDGWPRPRSGRARGAPPPCVPPLCPRPPARPGRASRQAGQSDQIKEADPGAGGRETPPQTSAATHPAPTTRPAPAPADEYQLCWTLEHRPTGLSRSGVRAYQRY